MKNLNHFSKLVKKHDYKYFWFKTYFNPEVTSKFTRYRRCLLNISILIIVIVLIFLSFHYHPFLLIFISATLISLNSAYMGHVMNKDYKRFLDKNLKLFVYDNNWVAQFSIGKIAEDLKLSGDLSSKFLDNVIHQSNMYLALSGQGINPVVSFSAALPISAALALIFKHRILLSLSISHFFIVVALLLIFSIVFYCISYLQEWYSYRKIRKIKFYAEIIKNNLFEHYQGLIK